MSTENTTPATDTPNAAPVVNETATPVVAEAAAPTAPVVPEKYELKPVDGSPVDAKYLESFQTYAKEKGMTQEQAQQLFERETFAVSEYASKLDSEFEAQKSQWIEAVKKDPEIGGDHFQQNVELAHRALERFGAPSFVKELDASGYGNHPELVRVFARIGKALSEDRFIDPGANTGGKRSMEEIFYGKQN